METVEKPKITSSLVASQLDTSQVFTVLLDETQPKDDIGVIAVKEISVNGKKIYKESQIMYFFFGLTFLLIVYRIFFKKHKDNIS